MLLCRNSILSIPGIHFPVYFLRLRLSISIKNYICLFNLPCFLQWFFDFGIEGFNLPNAYRFCRVGYLESDSNYKYYFTKLY